MCICFLGVVCVYVTVVSSSLYVHLTVFIVVCVMRACFQVCQMMIVCVFLRLGACLCVPVCDSASVILSDGVDVHLCSCDGFWAAISEQCQ